jgi:hypothetical protein
MSRLQRRVMGGTILQASPSRHPLRSTRCSTGVPRRCMRVADDELESHHQEQPGGEPTRPTQRT